MKKTMSVFFLVILTFVATNCKTTPPPATPVTEFGPKTIFYDNFNGHKNEWQQGAGIWQWTSEGFLIQRTADPRALNTLVYVQNPQISDATIETYVRIQAEHPAYMDLSTERDRAMVNDLRFIIGAGIIFRMRDPQNYYMFRLAGEEGAVLGKMVNGEWIDIDNPRTVNMLQGKRIQFGGSNLYRLKVEVYGNRIVCYIQDVPVISKTDETFGLGYFGLTTFKTNADFDYIKVYNKQESEVKGQSQ
jgi:hypothetical protein